ncbi:sigma-70 family RNA polymerase sigma factor [Chitinophaga horti]|uniref:Sigma-70 family RNA polymerase sigma factor n=1 Tax=Chitinophaga horti TaxID=2920382 RepID=A0ABY6J233_9BACT|nr:sigma-70 family RNA polymerase sigma factor [Chitinophaga horti]UYQ92411.1 sigma-70 family RNA polymerase sigma factor [Chitinophaga horti]
MSEIRSTDDNLRIWWEAVLGGDTLAYSHVHELLHPVLYRYAFAMLNDEALANDVVQELFIKIWFKKERIGMLQNVRAFWLTALRRQTLNQLRSLRRLQILPPSEPDIEFSTEDIIITAEQQQDLKAKIARYLNELPKRQKEIIYLYYYEELSYDEIAGVMDINYQSVLNLMQKALKQLRELVSHLPLLGPVWLAAKIFF